MNQLEKQERNELFDNILDISDFKVDNEIKEYVYQSSIEKELLQLLIPLYSSNAGKDWYMLADEICMSKENPDKWLDAVLDAFGNGISYSVVEKSVKQCSSETEFIQMIIASSESAAVSQSDFDEPEVTANMAESKRTEVTASMAESKRTEVTASMAESRDFEEQAMETLMGYMDRQLSDEAPDLQKVEELISGAMHARDILKKYLERIKGLENMAISQKQLLNQQMSQINEQKEEIQMLKSSIDFYKEQLSEKTAKEQNVSSLLEQLSHIR